MQPPEPILPETLRHPPAEDEIDLRDLARLVWRGRWPILGAALFALGLAAAYLHAAERTYTVKMTVKPAQEADAGPNLAGFAGLASFAGISLPSGSTSDFDALPMMMASEEIAARLLDDALLMQVFFAAEREAGTGAWRAPAPSMPEEAARVLKRLLTGEAPAAYAPPDAARLAERLAAIRATADRATGFLTLAVEVPDPERGRYLLDRVFAATDEHLRQRYLASSAQSLDFYRTQLSQARSSEHREALARIMAAEEQKLMLATRSERFVAEVLTGPTASRAPTAPKPGLVLALGLVLGVFAGASLVLVRHAAGKGGPR